jgi:hypothetical protein
MQVDDLKDVTFQCIHFLSTIEIPPLSELSDSGFKTFEMDGSSIRSKRDLLNSLAKTLSLPENFDFNWDSVDESLVDLSSHPAAGYILMIRHSHLMWSKTPESAGRLIEGWLYAAEIRATEDLPFHLIFVMED